MALNRLTWRGVIELIGVVGVVGSLTFIGLEVEQNTEAVRSSVIGDVSRWSYDATVLLVESREYRDAVKADCNGELSEDQREYLRLLYAAMLRIQLNRFYQSRLGVLDEQSLLALGGGEEVSTIIPHSRTFGLNLKIVLTRSFKGL